MSSWRTVPDVCDRGHPAFAGANNYIKHTAETSGCCRGIETVVEKGVVPPRARVRILIDSAHAAKVAPGFTRARKNIVLGNTSHTLLLRSKHDESLSRSTMSMTTLGRPDNDESADHAASLGAMGVAVRFQRCHEEAWRQVSTYSCHEKHLMVLKGFAPSHVPTPSRPTAGAAYLSYVCFSSRRPMWLCILLACLGHPASSPWLPWSVVLRYHGFILLGVCSPSLCWCDCFVRALAPCLAHAPFLILTSPASWSRHRGRSASCCPCPGTDDGRSNNDKPDSHIGVGVVWDSSSSGQTEAHRLSLTHKRPSQHSYSCVVQHTRRVESTVVAPDGWASWRQPPCGDP